MIQDTITARLNLNAVLRNLEDLPKLDPKAAEIIRPWDVSIRFAIRGDVSARLAFREGACTFCSGSSDGADVSLFFWSHAHFNAMIDRGAAPIPLKGFTRLGFLKNEFPKVSERLEYFLKPSDELLRDEVYLRINTTLTLYTAVHAACELIQLDPVARAVGQQMPAGTLQLSVLPDGPHAHIVYDGRGGAVAGTGAVANPTAVISFSNCVKANALFNGKLDGFGAIALGDVKLRGVVPIIENTNLILDRIPLYLQ